MSPPHITILGASSLKSEKYYQCKGTSPVAGSIDPRSTEITRFVKGYLFFRIEWDVVVLLEPTHYNSWYVRYRTFTRPCLIANYSWINFYLPLNHSLNPIIYHSTISIPYFPRWPCLAFLFLIVFPRKFQNETPLWSPGMQRTPTPGTTWLLASGAAACWT